MATPIRDYFLIGDLHTAALVSKHGAIDWMCLPCFDSPSVFAAVLDEEKGGSFRPDMPDHASSARYVPDTAIVETSFENAASAFTIRDFMVPRPTEEDVPHHLLRIIEGTRGTTTVHMTFDPRPDYARQRSIISGTGPLLEVRIDDRTAWLHVPANAQISPRENTHGIDISFEVKEGEKKHIALEYAAESRLELSKRNLEQETIDFWRSWIAEGTFEYSREHLVRSAITLKLMQFYPTGGIIAAPTTSLPEEIGGVRNWDYRYVWVRDATFTLYAFYVLGFVNEAERFFRFIERIAKEATRCDETGTCDLDISIMYTIWGTPLDEETALAHLDGYEGSKPVRIGNGASKQFQLDVFGSLIDCYYFMNKRGVPISQQGKEVIQMLVRGIQQRWQRPDSGIWEVRGGDRHFTYSKVMAWLGVERALRLADALQISDAQRDAWTALKDEIAAWIWENCYDAVRGTFTQSPETRAQDATNFTFILFFFLSRHDEKAKKLIAETKRELTKNELYVYRYLTDDGLDGGEGAFIFCMFWQIAAMASVGQIAEADELLKRIERLMPESGLMAEEIDPMTGAFLGNHPQAFSHVGYILATYYVDRYDRRQ